MIHFRSGSVDDINHILKLFDENIEWLVERGREAQWGSEPWSGDEKKIGFVRDLLSNGNLTIAEMDGEVVGASLLSENPMSYVPPVDEPERYLTLLIASPKHRGERIGQRLIVLARERTRHDGVELLRVDCWCGGDGKLVDYYTRQGFVPTEQIEVRPGTSVQVFEWRDD